MSVSNRMSRRRFVAGAAGAMAWASTRAQAAEAGGPWRVGCGRREITPPRDVGILMSSGLGQWAPFEGVRLPLYARAVVIDSAPSRVGLVALDLLGLADEAVGGMGEFKRRVAAHAGDALRPEQIVLTSTHTHSGPESLALTDLCHGEPFQRWVTMLAERIGAALGDAARSLQPCRLMVGSLLGPGLSVNRRVKTARGIVFSGAVRADDVVEGPEGPTDDRIGVAAFVDPSGRPLAVLVNATAHPVYEMCLKQVSPDYPGEMARLLDQRHPGATALFLQGADGNINSPEVSTGPAAAQRHGRQLADLVDRALGDLRPVEGSQLALRWRAIELPARSIEGKPQEEPLRATLGAARLGGAAIVFLPGEPFVEIALAIREASPFDFTAVAGYAEGYIGYIPTDRALGNGGYETGPGRWSRVALGSEVIVRREAVQLLKSLKDGS
jgi:neutral ceramidase